MKIIVLIPSEDYRLNAGARIRYGRIVADLAAAGHQLVLEDINDFDPVGAECSVAVLSKCHDARSLMCARVLMGRGIPVGVDLFDDYFSQTHDSRMARYRDWLDALVPVIDFAMCSTPTMAEVAHRYRADMPVHVMNDPVDSLGLDLASILRSKQATAKNDRTIDLCWFGMGDNPHFRVGLSDLAAFADELIVPVELDYNVRITVLTNARALDAEGLAMLSRLPLDVSVEEWSPNGEAAALSRATACVLPVNAQHFSVAKSLNRAMSALSGGCQVLTLGYPLYEPLEALLYDDISSLCRDLDAGTLLLRPETLPIYDQLKDRFASSANEANRLASFLEGRLSAERGQNEAGMPRMAIIHGNLTSGAAHKFAQRLGALAVRSPFSVAKLGYDVFFGGRIGQPNLDMFLTERSISRLLPEVRGKLRNAGTIGTQQVWALSARGDPGDIDWSEAPLTLQLAMYATTIRDMRQQIEAAFGPIAIILSEQSPHAFSARAA